MACKPDEKYDGDVEVADRDVIFAPHPLGAVWGLFMEELDFMKDYIKPAPFRDISSALLSAICEKLEIDISTFDAESQLLELKKNIDGCLCVSKKDSYAPLKGFKRKPLKKMISGNCPFQVWFAEGISPIDDLISQGPISTLPAVPSVQMALDAWSLKNGMMVIRKLGEIEAEVMVSERCRHPNQPIHQLGMARIGVQFDSDRSGWFWSPQIATDNPDALQSGHAAHLDMSVADTSAAVMPTADMPADDMPKAVESASVMTAMARHSPFCLGIAHGIDAKICACQILIRK